MSVFDVGAYVANRVLDLGMAEKDLNRSRVPRCLVDDRGLGSTERMCPVFTDSQADRFDPLIDQRRILPRAWMTSLIDAACKGVVLD